MRLTRKIIIVLIILILVFWIWYVWQISSPAGSGQGPKNFEISLGSSVSQISQKLYEQGLIKSEFFFKAYVRLNRLDRKFSQGVFSISPGQGIKEIVEILTNPGEGIKKLTIIEGKRNREISDYLSRAGFEALEFLNLADKNYSEFVANYEFLRDKPLDRGLEGYLFPDTYLVFANSSSQDLIVKMLDNFKNKVTGAMLEEISKQQRSLFEVVVLASIIEKEVARPEDMAMVSDIFLKRLAAGLPLQSDATINYLTNSGKAQSSLEDLKIDSPYNTYLYKGLPWGPISNPGLAAIEAAIYHQKNEYYYFLTAKDGQVYYAKNYDEHLNNKRLYLPAD